MKWIDSTSFPATASSGTNTYSKILGGAVKIVGAYAKNETTPCYMEIYLRETSTTTNRERHYLASGFISDIRKAQSWDGERTANSPYYIVFVFKGCAASDVLKYGWTWEIER